MGLIVTTIRWTCLAALWTATVSVAGEPPPGLSHWLRPQEWQRDTVGPIVSLGKPSEFDDMDIFAPTVALEDGRYSMWYCGSRDTREKRVFRLGLATSSDGKQFEKFAENPVFRFSDDVHSVLTPALLRSGEGTVVREDGKLRMWFSSTAFGKTNLHTLHEARSADGIHWTEPSTSLLNNVYCPTVLKTSRGYEMWYSDVGKRPWVIRHALSTDGTDWKVSEPIVLQLSQPWEAEIVVYPSVLHVDGAYLMWYGSYYSAVRRQTTAVGFAASIDGLRWHKHPQNPVLRPEPDRPWESNYVGSGCVIRLADGSFRYWYASRKAPPFVNLYFAINTARWAPQPQGAWRLPLPPAKGDVGILESSHASPNGRRELDVLEVVGADDAIVRA